MFPGVPYKESTQDQDLQVSSMCGASQAYTLKCLLHACNKKACRSFTLFYALAGEEGRQKRREVTDLQWQIERFVYTRVPIQTGDAGLIRKLRERVQLK